jgi:hypothetical protein
MSAFEKREKNAAVLSRGGEDMKGKEKREKDKTEKEGERETTDCFYVVDPCGCYMVDPCGYAYVNPCCC